jgi:hypothetical protein
MILGLTLQQGIILRLFLQQYLFIVWPSACYKCMAGHTAIYNFNNGLSEFQDFRTDLIAFYYCRDGLSAGHNFRASSYNKLCLYVWNFSRP